MRSIRLALGAAVAGTMPGVTRCASSVVASLDQHVKITVVQKKA